MSKSSQSTFRNDSPVGSLQSLQAAETVSAVMPFAVPDLTCGPHVQLNKRVPLHAKGVRRYCSTMGKKQTRLPNNPPSFAELYRMYEELLRLRNDIETEEAKSRVAADKSHDVTDPEHD